MDSSIRLGKIFGIPLGINYSWLIVFGLVIFLMSARFGDLYPQWPLLPRWSVAVFTTVLFFLSVLVHELSHSLVALAWGIPVRGITLFIFGGVSQLEHEATRPLTEFLVSVIGPVTSLVLAAILGVSWNLVGGYSSYLSAILFTLFAINLSLGIFNMLPGFPLDGGRVLRAGIWGATGNYWLATRLALWAGQGLGLLMVVGGIAWALTGNIEALWLALVGGFLVYVATANYRQEALRHSARARRLSDLVPQAWESLPGNLPVLSSQALTALAGAGYVGVLVYGPPHGVVTGAMLTGLSSYSIQSSTLGEIMAPLASFPCIDADTPLFDALEKMESLDVNIAAVVRGDFPVGLATRAEIIQLLRSSRRTGRRRG